MANDTESKQMKTGTTTVGVLSKDGVVLAADKRSTLGRMIYSKKSEKIAPVNERAVITQSGTVSTIQLVKKILRARVRLKELDGGRTLQVKEIAQILSRLNFSNARTPRPEISQWLLGGYDEEPRLFDVMPDGAVFEAPKEEGYLASGSGMMFAVSVLEDRYEEDMSLEDARSLAVRAVHSATKRDSASGNGIDVYVIDEDGARYVENKKIEAVLK